MLAGVAVVVPIGVETATRRCTFGEVEEIFKVAYIHR
jgi:hypothetical protein